MRHPIRMGNAFVELELESFLGELHDRTDVSVNVTLRERERREFPSAVLFGQRT